MFIILVSEDTTTDDIGHSIDIQSLPFEIDDNSSVLMPSSLIMYESNAIIESMCQLVFNRFFYNFQIQ